MFVNSATGKITVMLTFRQQSRQLPRNILLWQRFRSESRLNYIEQPNGVLEKCLLVIPPAIQSLWSTNVFPHISVH